MNKDLIRQARMASVEDYLKGRGETLVREGKQYRVKKHPGLVVSGNKWYSHTLLKGGNTLDYLVEMEGMDFKKAVAEDVAIDAYLTRVPGIHKIVFCLDNDKAGHDAYESFFKKYSMKDFKVYKHFPTQKDWNMEALCRVSSNP